MARPKDARFEARLDVDDDALLSWAAQQTGTTKTAFVLGTALDRARELQSRESLTFIARDQAEEFLAWLEGPPAVLPGLEALEAAEPFEQR